MDLKWLVQENCAVEKFDCKLLMILHVVFKLDLRELKLSLKTEQSIKW